MEITKEKNLNSEARRDSTDLTQNRISTNSRNDQNLSFNTAEINPQEEADSDPPARIPDSSEAEVNSKGINLLKEEFPPSKRRLMRSS